MNNIDLINKLKNDNSLTLEEYEILIKNRDKETAKILAKLADEKRKSIYSNEIYIRGLIEISNICKNNCYYCGIRCSNKNVNRYRLSKEEIIDCTKEGYKLGYRTFVLQGGEDSYFSDELLCDIISNIKNNFSDVAITLSVGERSYDSYKALYDAGADRYLLRHETADKDHYNKLHPQSMSFDNRINCLYNLKEIGYQVGCGFMIGSPYQTDKTIAKDLKFIEEFSPDMCGIGPFISHKDTIFKNKKNGTLELTTYLLSIIRLIKSNILLPATTALSTIADNGRELGIKSGANVIMPNLSPNYAREKYELYDNKKYDLEESAQSLNLIKKSLNSIGYKIVTSRGDIKL